MSGLFENFNDGYRPSGDGSSTSVDSVRVPFDGGCEDYPSIGERTANNLPGGKPGDTINKDLLNLSQTIHIEIVSTIDSPFQQDDASRPAGTVSKCPVCGKEFVLEHDHQKFCSRKCYEMHHNMLAKRKRELMKDDPAFIARKRLLNDRRNERRAASRAARLGIPVEELMRGRDPRKRGRPRKVQEHEVKPDVNWKEEVLKVLSMPDPSARFEASRKWTDEQRRYAKSIYLGMLRDDFSYRRESFC